MDPRFVKRKVEEVEERPTREMNKEELLGLLTAAEREELARRKRAAPVMPSNVEHSPLPMTAVTESDSTVLMPSGAPLPAAALPPQAAATPKPLAATAPPIQVEAKIGPRELDARMVHQQPLAPMRITPMVAAPPLAPPPPTVVPMIAYPTMEEAEPAAPVAVKSSRNLYLIAVIALILWGVVLVAIYR